MAAALILLALAAGYRVFFGDGGRGRAAPASNESAGPLEEQPGFIYGRVTTVTGGTYEGRLRFGGTQEAFWGDYFNGTKPENRWAAHVPAGRLPTERRPREIFGIRFTGTEKPVDLERLFMARFGDIARVESVGRDVVRVTLKSGTAFDLNRMDASDFDDGVRVWDGGRGVVDLDTLMIRSIEFLPTPPLAGAPDRLHGTVHSRGREFTGFIQWDRESGVGSDTLEGRNGESPFSAPFHTIRTVERHPEGSVVTLRDGGEVTIGDARAMRGIYVEDSRYGRVLVSWDAFERLDLEPAGSGPAYDDFPPGAPLSGSVTTRDGRSLAGRIVYDLDESETTETLDAPADGVDYTIHFGLVASIVPEGEGDAGRAALTLHSGEQLPLERSGDLGDQNAGLLVFSAAEADPEYVRWSEVARVDFEAPSVPPVP